MIWCMSDCQERSAATLNNNMDTIYVVLQDSITGLTARLKEVESELAATKDKHSEDAHQPSMDTTHATSPEKTLISKENPWEDGYLQAKIDEVYHPLNNNVK